MKKNMNIICLIIWIVFCVFGVRSALLGNDINAVLFVFSTLVGILHYISEVLAMNN